MGLVTLWKNWLPWSQGVVIAPLLAKFRSPWLRIFWFGMLIATTAAFLYQSVCMVQDYLSYRKTTNIQLFTEPEAPFPAVTFCNLNPFKRSMVHRSKELSNLVTAYNYVKKVKQAQHLSTHTTILPSNRTVTPGLNRKKRAASQGAGTGQTVQPPGAGQTAQSSGAGQTGNSSGTAKFTTTPLTTLTTTMPSTTTTTTTTTTLTSTSTTTPQLEATTTNTMSTTSVVPSITTSTTSITVDVITSNAPATAEETTAVPTTVTTTTPTTSTDLITSTTTVLTSTYERTSPTTESASTGAASSLSTTALTNMMMTSTSKTISLPTSTSPSITATSEPSSSTSTAANPSVSTTAQTLTSSPSPLTTVASTTSASSVMSTSIKTSPGSISAETAASTHAATTSELNTTTRTATTTASTTAGLIMPATETSITSETTTATTASTTVTETVPTAYRSSTIAAPTVTASLNTGASASASTSASNTSMASGSDTTPAPAVDGGTSTASTTIAHGTLTTGTTFVSIAPTAPAVITTSTATTATTMTSIATTTSTPFSQVKLSSTTSQSSKVNGESTTYKPSNPTASSAPTLANNIESATAQVMTSSDIQETTSSTMNSIQTVTETSRPSANRSIAGVSAASSTTQLSANTEEHLTYASTQVPVEHGTSTTFIKTKTAASNSASPLRSTNTNPALQTGNTGLVTSTDKTVQEASAASDATTLHSRPATKTVFDQRPTTATSTHGTERSDIVGNTSKPGPSTSTRITGASSTTGASGTKSTAAQQMYAQSTTVLSTAHSTASFPIAKVTYVGTPTEQCVGCTGTGGLLTSTLRVASGPISSSSANPGSEPILSSDAVHTSIPPSQPTTSLASEAGTSSTVARSAHAVVSSTTRSFSDEPNQTIAAQTSSTGEETAGSQELESTHNTTSSASATTQHSDKTLSSKRSLSIVANQLSTIKNASGKSVETLTTVHPGLNTNGTHTVATSNATTTRRRDRGPTSDGRDRAKPSVPPSNDYSESSPKSKGTTVTTTKALPATITVPKINLKNITLDLGSDFDLADLTDEQRKNLDALSNAYGLDPDSDQLSIDARMKQALQVVAATMPPEVREIVGFHLKDLVSSCIINGEPCDRDSDFKLTFDVDYGNCYTFNAGTPVKYIARRSGASYGLRMTIISNVSEQLPSTAEEGVKIVVHGQEKMPFPNVHGYKSSPGRLASHIVTYSKVSRLGAPYGRCSTNDSTAANGQPFYYNGSYSMEGCFRSCFQRNLSRTCGCADARFPTPTDMNVPFCDPLEPMKYKCLEAYIKMKGDYYFVDNCNCYEPCEVTRYKSQIAEGIWPVGGFFYGPYCPMAKQLNFSDCSQFYGENGMVLEVSFAQLGYELLEEDPVCTVWCLMNNLAGNTGFWVGYTMISFTECILIAAQVLLWIFRCPRELPEVPSCCRRNFFAVHEDGGSEEDVSDVRGRYSGKVSPTPSTPVCDGSTVPPGGPLAALRRRASALPRHILPPKNFDNCFGVTTISPQDLRAEMPSSRELYSHESPYESVNPVAAHSTHYADRTVVE